MRRPCDAASTIATVVHDRPTRRCTAHCRQACCNVSARHTRIARVMAQGPMFFAMSCGVLVGTVLLSPTVVVTFSCDHLSTMLTYNFAIHQRRDSLRTASDRRRDSHMIVFRGLGVSIVTLERSCWRSQTAGAVKDRHAESSYSLTSRDARLRGRTRPTQRDWACRAPARVLFQ